MKQSRRLKLSTGALAMLTLLVIGLALAGSERTACAQDGCCACSDPPGSCVGDGCIIFCQEQGGGDDPPQPTQVWTPQPPGPGPTQPPGPGPTQPPGPGPTAPPGGTPTSPPGTPAPTPTPPPGGTYVIFHCAPWPECDEGWADVTALLGRDGNWYVVEVDCLEESACVLPTATPGPGPTPGPGGNDFPCDDPPSIVGGIIHQDCTEWPGWYIDAEVVIPPAAVLRNPWPRGLVGLPNQLWYQRPAAEPEEFSEPALECPGVDYGARYDEPTFDCSGTVGQVTQGARVDFQIGAAWRHWQRGMGPLFGQTPPDEVVWVVQDREWNGGSRVATGDHLVHVFETSSWGLEADGPTWNPECQERTCDYDERVADYLGAESYQANVLTWWWPEWTFRYDEYECSQADWGACWGPYPPPGYPVGVPSRPCDHDGDGVDDPGYHQEQTCSQWRWRQHQEPLECPPGSLNPDTGWCKYDLRALGLDPLMGWTGVVVAGADAEGQRQGSWTDRWPHYIPVPVVEVQPVAPN